MNSRDSKRDGHDPIFNNLVLAFVTGMVGFITILIIVVAVIAGLWLDGHFQTKPVITLTLVIGSIPVSLFVMFIVIRKVASSTIAHATSTEKDKKLLQGEGETNLD